MPCWKRTYPYLQGALFVFLLGACGARTDYLVTGLEINRLGWDSLEVRINFASHTVFGGTDPIEPGVATVTLFDADYDTLYQGVGPIAFIPDAEMGNLEPFIVEVCGLLREQLVCDQRGLAASPKRVHVNHEILYPLDQDFQEGRYDLQFAVERRQFEGEGWEVTDSGQNFQGHLLAYVDETLDEPVRIPFQRESGRFDLSEYDHFRDFQYNVKSALKDGRDAIVLFDVYAGFGQDVRLLASDQKRIHIKTHEERYAEVAYYVEEAVEKMVDRMRISEHLVVFVDSWRYDQFEHRYAVDIVIQQQEPFFGRDRLEGRLEFSEDGGGATFRLYEDYGRMRRLWRNRMEERTVELGTLLPLITEGRHPEEEAPLIP